MIGIAVEGLGREEFDVTILVGHGCDTAVAKLVERVARLASADAASVVAECRQSELVVDPCTEVRISVRSVEVRRSGQSSALRPYLSHAWVTEQQQCNEYQHDTRRDLSTADHANLQH